MSLPEVFDVLPRHPAVTWAPFHVGHVMTMDIKSQDMSTLSRAMPVHQMLEVQAMYGQAITAIIHGRPAACFGSVRVWNGVEELWMLTEERTRKLPVLMTRAAKDFADYRVIAGNLHRLQVTVRSNDTRAFRWAKCLGFEMEAVLEKYGPDKMDYFVMRKV